MPGRLAVIEDIVARLRTADAGLRREITSIPADAPSLLLEAVGYAIKSRSGTVLPFVDLM